ncbi:hypothetical protein OROGR_031286 [Orobanche gracilis]
MTRDGYRPLIAIDRWVRAVDKIFNVLKTTSLNHRQREIAISSANPLQIAVDESPFVKNSETGVVSAVGDNLVNRRQKNHKVVVTITAEENARGKQNIEIGISHRPSVMPFTGEVINDMVAPIKKYLNQVSSHNQKSLWLLSLLQS